MQVTEVFTTEINFQAGDEVPVYDDERNIVGRVLVVRPAYILDGVTHTQVTVEITEDAAKRAVVKYTEVLRPVLHMFFPRSHDPLEQAFRV